MSSSILEELKPILESLKVIDFESIQGFDFNSINEIDKNGIGVYLKSIRDKSTLITRLLENKPKISDNQVSRTSILISNFEKFIHDEMDMNDIILKTSLFDNCLNYILADLKKEVTGNFYLLFYY